MQIMKCKVEKEKKLLFLMRGSLQIFAAGESGADLNGACAKMPTHSSDSSGTLGRTTLILVIASMNEAITINPSGCNVWRRCIHDFSMSLRLLEPFTIYLPKK